MQAEIITIGDEILIGQIVDSNSAFIAKELNQIGVSVYQITSVQDDREHITNALQEAGERSSVIIVTGGLGPTKDAFQKVHHHAHFRPEPQTGIGALQGNSAPQCVRDGTRTLDEKG